MKLTDQIKQIADGAPYAFESSLSVEDAVQAMRSLRCFSGLFPDPSAKVTFEQTGDERYQFKVKQTLGRMGSIENIYLSGEVRRDGNATVVIGEIPIHEFAAAFLVCLVLAAIFAVGTGTVLLGIGLLVVAWLSLRYFTAQQIKLLACLEKMLKITKPL